GVTINESISKLFFAGVLPGLVLALMFAGYVAVMSRLSRDWNPDAEPRQGFAAKLANSRFLIPVFALIGVVIGSMYLGYATATEAAALGVIGALVLAAIQGSLSWQTFTESLMGATRTSAMIALILAGAAFLSMAMGFTGLPRGLADLIGSFELSRFELLMVLLVFYIILGMFLDGISSVVLTMAVVEPMVREAGIDLIWFGIFVVVVVEMAQITPPIGFNLFVLQGMTQHEMGYIARAAFPMFLIMVVMVFVLILFPELATWLPDNLRPGPGG
ncbi:MAG: TRAP transporter large permease subunit, partial [Paracoccaceae bacterium]|nr:TRAP transporter large permease subunit [Paracoccaceae bacterium]